MATLGDYPGATYSKNPETKRRLRQYRRRRRALIVKMGSICRYCAAQKHIEFHHTQPKDWIPSKTSRLQRIRNYERDYAKGVLQLACRSCNATFGVVDYDDPNPF